MQRLDAWLLAPFYLTGSLAILTRSILIILGRTEEGHSCRAWKGVPMINLSASQKQQLVMYQDHLVRLERGEAWLVNHPGRPTAEEKAKEIGRLKALIAKVEAGEA